MDPLVHRTGPLAVRFRWLIRPGHLRRQEDQILSVLGMAVRIGATQGRRKALLPYGCPAPRTVETIRWTQ